MTCDKCHIDLIVYKGEEICPKCGLTIKRIHGRNPIVDQIIPKKCDKCGKTSDEGFLTHQGNNIFHCSEHLVSSDVEHPDIAEVVYYGILMAPFIE